MTSASNLYLLIFPEKEIIKIGKADDIYSRVQSLKKWWGEVDYENSYHLSAPEHVIFKLEKSLHFFLSEYSIEFDCGDGKTELFSKNALDIALKHIDLLKSSSSKISEIQKGVSIPKKQILVRKNKKNNIYNRHLKKANAMKESIVKLSEKFNKINRLLIILRKKQERIHYHYNIDKSSIIFRIRNTKHTTEIAAKIIHYFLFEIDDFDGSIFLNCCSMTGNESITQYQIDIPKFDTNSKMKLFEYFFNQSMILLELLPEKSPTLETSLPIII